MDDSLPEIVVSPIEVRAAELKVAELDAGIKLVSGALTPAAGEAIAAASSTLSEIESAGPAVVAPGPQDSPAEYLGQIIGQHYRLDRLLGHGGMSCVYLGTDLRTHKHVAVKLLHRQWSMHPQTLKRFEQEGEALSRLDHKNIVKVYEYGFHQTNVPYMAMELVEGTPLSSMIHENHKLSVQSTINIAIQVCHALDYAHSLRIVHRDLKPANIMVCLEDNDQWSAKLLDFGIAKIVSEDQMQLTHAGQVFGSPFYMSPEQCLGLPVDRRTDFYSLGCVLFECLTGSPPFYGDGPVSTMSLHQSASVPTLKEGTLGEYFPQSLEALVAKLLSKNPDDRYQNAREIVVALSEVKIGDMPVDSGAGAAARAGDIDILRSLRADCAERAFKQQEARRQAQEEVSKATSNKMYVWVLSAAAAVAVLFAMAMVVKSVSPAASEIISHLPFFTPADRSDNRLDDIFQKDSPSGGSSTKSNPDTHSPTSIKTGSALQTKSAISGKEASIAGAGIVAAVIGVSSDPGNTLPLGKTSRPAPETAAGVVYDLRIDSGATAAGKQTAWVSVPDEVTIENMKLSVISYKKIAASSLRSIKFWHCRVHGLMTALLANNSILMMEFKDCDISDSDLDSLPSSVRDLRLNNCRITNSGVQRLTLRNSLRTLDLSHNVVTDDCLNALAMFDGLESLDLTGTKVTRQGMAKLLDAKTNLVITAGDAR